MYASIRRTCKHAFLVALIGLAASSANADLIQYLVVVDEIVGPGHAYYIGSASHRDTKDCPKNSGVGYVCSLNYNLTAGVPTVMMPPFNGRLNESGIFNSGDYLLLEPKSESDKTSDLIRFPSLGKDKKGKDLGTNSIQFYSEPDDTDTDGSTDVPPPSSTATAVREFDLGAFFQSADAPTDGGGNSFGLNLKGMTGYYKTALANDPGGQSKGMFSIGYLFISDGDASKIYTLAPKFEAPEPSTALLAGAALLGILLCRLAGHRHAAR